ncbi:tachykinin family protein [Akanthomyces lecanii RCEF 1005]|uniref:Tachykinin family protein n=1 Tax=Akanthomyces lecanii RCEF 1005 TaxID=1081108 RepID=A0A168FFK3_CORDF|nr:tachykinin family protein [Akanthomyces lecanii RCEF 1005]
MESNDDVPPLVERAPEFVFVSEQDQSSVRSHAMREHWKQRHHSRELKRRKSLSQVHRPLRPNTGHKSSGSISATSRTSHSSSASPTKPSTPPKAGAASKDAQISASGILGGLFSALGSGVMLNGGGIPAQLLEGVNRALACSQLDPFDAFPVRLTSEHHKLLHHWLSKYAAMMFEDLPSSTFNPMRDVWFPLDLSNAASFNAVMAHSAAHLAHVQGIRDSEEALKFKMEAVRIVTLWMSDSERALSDDAFAAVLRLLTYERYWGTETEWKIHRYGLSKMVAARGGITALEGNWRLELAIFLVLLMSKPTWFDTTNHIWELSKTDASEPEHPILGHAENVLKVRSLWLISFIQDLRTFMDTPSARLTQYPSIQAAMAILVADFRQSAQNAPLRSNDVFTTHEFSRVACIFFICVLLQSVSQPSAPSPGGWDSMFSDAAESADSLLIIDTLLSESSNIWQTAGPEALYGTLFHGVYDLPDKAKKMEYVLNLTSVLGQTSSEARRGVSKCLLHILYPNQANPSMVYRGDNWTPDSLLSSIHGL